MKPVPATTTQRMLANPTADESFADAIVAFERNDYDAALSILCPMAEKGYAPAQHKLGRMYDEGRGVEKDNVEAVKWFKLAAMQGVSYAQSNLGNMYYSGEGVEKDDVEAVKWFKLAATQNNANAQYNLGVIYSEGCGVEKDNVEAMKWYKLAAAQDHPYAEVYLALSPEALSSRINDIYSTITNPIFPKSDAG